MVNLRYFVRAHTALGERNLLEGNLEDIKQIIYLEGDISELHAIFEALVNSSEADNFELFLYPNDPQFIEGLIWKEKAVIICAYYLAFDTDLPTDYLVISRSKEKHDVDGAYDILYDALQSHDDLEAVYYDYMDLEKADQVAKQLITELDQYERPVKEKSKKVRRFFGTFNYKGSNNIAEELLESVTYVYHIKGEAGNGKSYLLKQVIAWCESVHLDHEIYHCNFDPDSIDMVMIREIDLCLLDSTAPHAFPLKNDTDLLVDMYEEIVDKKIEVEKAKELQQFESDYLNKISQAKDYLLRHHHRNNIDHDLDLSFDLEKVKAYLIK